MDAEGQRTTTVTFVISSSCPPDFPSSYHSALSSSSSSYSSDLISLSSRPPVLSFSRPSVLLSCHPSVPLSSRPPALQSSLSSYPPLLLLLLLLLQKRVTKKSRHVITCPLPSREFIKRFQPVEKKLGGKAGSGSSSPDHTSTCRPPRSLSPSRGEPNHGIQIISLSRNRSLPYLFFFPLFPFYRIALFRIKECLDYEQRNNKEPTDSDGLPALLRPRDPLPCESVAAAN